MICCYGLVQTDVDAIKSFLPNERLYRPNQRLPKDSLVIALGLREVSRNRDKLLHSYVLVLDALVRFSPYSIPIIDNPEPLKRAALIKRLNTPTDPIQFTKPADPILEVLNDKKQASILNGYLNTRYAMAAADRKVFDAEFMDYLKTPTSTLFDELVGEKTLILRTALIDVLQGEPPELVSLKYGLDTYDLAYCHRLVTKPERSP